MKGALEQMLAVGSVGQGRSKRSMDVEHRILRRKLDSVDSISLWKRSEKATYSEIDSESVSDVLLICYNCAYVST